VSPAGGHALRATLSEAIVDPAACPLSRAKGGSAGRPAATPTGYTLGVNRIGMDPEGFAEAKLVMLWGANPLVTHHHFWKFVEAARRRSAHIVAIDPVRTRTADRLVAPAGPHFLNTGSRTCPRSATRPALQRVRLNAVDAQARGVADGDVARLYNHRGEYWALVEITDRVPLGMAGGAKGHWPKLNSGGTSIAATVMERDADMGRGAVYNDNRVEVERVAISREKFLAEFAALGRS
jgi:anaerobic selenocysteine-containing dehydrogenase